MAKQLGVADEALSGLKDPARHPFPPDQKAALLFADAMTSGPGQVPDPVYAELRRHFGEAQIVEIATVVGLFNYFNRFNNALHVEVTLMDPDVLLRRIEQTAGMVEESKDLCVRVAEMLRQGRRYRRVEIRRAEVGPTAPGTAAKGALTVPIRAGSRVVGLIEVESDRDDAFDEEDRPLLERVAVLLAPRLAS